MEKMTNVKAIEFVLGNSELPTEVKEKLEKMKAQFEKKNGAERKPTATQKENVDLKNAILDGMEVGKAYTIGDMIKSIPAVSDLTNQRVSALVRQLKDANLVVREEVKRKAYFTKAE